MTTLLMAVQIILTVLIVVAVLMQKSSSIGLGSYGSGGDSFFGAKGPASFMTKLTMLLGLLFVINNVALAYMCNRDANRSVMDGHSRPSSKKPIPLPINPLMDNAKSDNPFNNKPSQGGSK